ncbi:type I-C CRISPR-associated protein Cas8c/Csd1 [Paenibacillus macerans]|uniref:type I-C CRISPR-associated protein Cas8c/Csd1 n=1 Tax=Paenibacillus macerans TaxID=44252 RepID=UPI002041D600|nr:type I-C CRISPR-associated protein Cas8c/Csd1 [Paenibacillus macerans]MCM3701412.1 type I-C CRISPR-associated protein Cas8c/Csd1 [Paenibacillus macerans]
MSREVIFARLIAIATVLGELVFDKGTPTIASQFLTRIGREPAKTIAIIHERLMQHAHKFGPEEMQLLDMFGELIDQLDLETFDNYPLDRDYLIHYYKQKHALKIVGYKEAYVILSWDYEKNRTMLNTYLKRAEEKGWPKGMFPKPLQVLASGPIWYEKQIIDYRDARNKIKED